MRIGIVGCGYVADFYLATMANHPGLELAGVVDRDSEKGRRFAQLHETSDYGSLAALCGDPEVAVVVNLTNPRNHYEVSRTALGAGKHVYSEKPLATKWPQALELVELAERKGLQIVSAPCTLLGEAAQTVWKAVREGQIGTVRLAYAELDDGMVHRENYRTWISASGSPWPFRDEFEVGCTLEHAAYYVTWLAAMFGPAEAVTSFASCQIPDKALGTPLYPPDAPDFSCGCIRFQSGVVARLTCSIIGSHDHALRLFGDAGTLRIQECWDFGSPVTLSRRTKWTFRAERHPILARLVGLGPRRLPLVRRPNFRYKVAGANRIDFCRGIAELVESIRDHRPCRLSPRFSLHVNEIVLSLQDPDGMGSPRQLTTSFEPLSPMSWASV
jgi:predicted dehydrogenase